MAINIFWENPIIMKRFRKIYLEISNICNLHCRFCPGTKRPPHAMTEEEFTTLLPRLSPYTDFLYFHLMGEPLCHPLLERFLKLAGDAGFKVILTTNGVLLPRLRETLLSSPALHKINISLHAFEANDLSIPFSQYLQGCFTFGKAAEGRKIVCYRLWNGGGENAKNEDILSVMKTYYTADWVKERQGTRIGQRIYLEYGDKFDWPDLSATDGGDRVFCYGLKDQIGVLCDGTVVPCCLDHEGDISLGNLFTENLDKILANPKTQQICDGFAKGKAVQELCRKCGYARRFG